MTTTEPDLALRDDLTGVYNRRFLSQVIANRWPQLVAEHGQVAILIVDLDAFKAINDTHGHLTGDDVLRATARVLRQHLRADDVIARYGGDEFVVIAPGVGSSNVGRLAERARDALAAEQLTSSRTGRIVSAPLGFSIGVASVPVDGQSGEAVLQAADLRLYQDKRRRGRTAGWLFVPRRVVYVALAFAAILGLLIGSYVGAKVETTVSQRTLRRVALGSEAEPRDASLPLLSLPPSSPVAAATATAAVPADTPAPVEPKATPAPTPEPTPPATPPATPAVSRPDPTTARLEQRITELESEIARLRREREPGRVTPPPRQPDRVLAPGGQPVPTRVAGGPTATPAAGVPAAPRAAPAPSPASAVLIPAAVLEEVKPRYPRVAQALRLGATVEVRVVVDARGRVVQSEVVGPPAGYGFDEAAREAALRTRFRAATRDGQPLPFETVLQYRFTLR